MRLPAVNKPLNLKIKGKTCSVMCLDVFDGGYGWYFDAAFAKNTRYRFKPGERFAIPELGEECLADFVNYPTNEPWKVRFLISK